MTARKEPEGNGEVVPIRGEAESTPGESRSRALKAPKAKRPPTGKVAQQEALGREREAQAFELKKSGASFDAIAKALGYADPSGAYRAYRRVLDRYNATALENAGEFRTLEMARLERGLQAIWPQVLAGDLEAVRVLVRIVDAQARLLGLYTPVQHELSGREGGPIEVDVAQAREALLDRLSAIAERVAQRRAGRREAPLAAR